MPSQPSPELTVIAWFDNLRNGGSDAARTIWDEYCSRVKGLAHNMLGKASLNVTDESDIAASVFESVFDGAAQGRFPDLKSRDELWWLFATITHQKVVNEIRRQNRQKSGRGRTRTESELNNGHSDGFSLQNIMADETLPESIAAFKDEQERLLGMLKSEQLKKIAALRLGGHTHIAIADQLSICERTVKRKCDLVRDLWQKVLDAMTEERI